MLVTAFIIVACILFLIAAWRWPNPPPVELLALGLFFFALSFVPWGKI